MFIYADVSASSGSVCLLALNIDYNQIYSGNELTAVVMN
jgi:hypothetical protein